MKTKKIVLFLSMLVVMFTMTACSSGQEEVDFDYTEDDVISNSIYLTYSIQNVDEATKLIINNTEGQEVYQTAISNFEAADEECGEFRGFRTKDGSYLTMDSILTTSAQDEDAYKEVVEQLESTVEEDGENVNVILYAVYKNRDAEMEFVYEAAPTSASVDDDTGELNIPFKVSEITVSPEYTLGEQMSKAAMNTLMGMGTVFVILIFISLVIGQFERISKAIEAVGNAFTKRKEKKDAADETSESAAVAATTAPVAATANPMNDAQLVAVITAAIMAENAASGSGVDKLIVRSIKKAKR
jgi:Na+-transporting methylmalonyl-CoA/oxaloacetate decarboxylase gamma subunit